MRSLLLASLNIKIDKFFPMLFLPGRYDHFFCSGHVFDKQSGNFSVRSAPGNYVLSDNEDIFSKMGASRISRKCHLGLSISDAEVEYRRGRSLRQGKGDFAWCD